MSKWWKAAAGGVLGFLVGGPAGALEGAALGYAADNLIPKAPELPQLPDLAKQSKKIAAQAYVQQAPTRSRRPPLRPSQRTGPSGASPLASQIGAVKLLGD